MKSISALDEDSTDDAVSYDISGPNGGFLVDHMYL